MDTPGDLPAALPQMLLEPPRGTESPPGSALESPPGNPTPQPPAGEAAAELPRVLVFTRTLAFRHDSIPAGVAAVRDAGKGLYTVDATEDPAAFTPDNLRRYRAVVFLSTSGDVLDRSQEEAFEAFIRAGNGYVGIHAAADTEYDWPWYGRLIGAYFKGHPPVQPATVRVEDRAHPSTRMLPEEWKRTDEWYAFRSNPRAQVQVLASVDESTYEPGAMAMGDHPIAWCQQFEGGRSWYTAGGHTIESFAEPLFRAHIREGIAWAAGLSAIPPAAPSGGASPAAPPVTPAESSPSSAVPATTPGSMPQVALLSQALIDTPPVLAFSRTALILGAIMLAGAAVLGAMGSGVRAPLLAWIWPGLGHMSLGYRRRAILGMAGVLGMFFSGLLIGGVDAVDSREDGAWFIAQSGNGPLVFGVDLLNQGLLKTGRVGELVQAPAPIGPQGEGANRQVLVSSYKGLGQANEFGTLFIALGGLMNLVLVMDCARRDRAHRPEE